MFGLDQSNWLLVFLRAIGLMSIFPLFTAPNFPVRLRVALAALLAVLVAPTLPAAPLAGLPLPLVVGRMIEELLIGLTLGFISRMVFYAMDFAGGVMGAEMGLNLPANLNPLAGTQVTAPGMVLYFLGAMLFLGLDLHHWLLMAFQRSYTLLPAGAAQVSAPLAVEVLRQTSRTFELAVRMCAPFIAVSFVVTLVFSVLGRAVPQMNVFTESFTVRVLAGLVVFGLTCQLLAQHIVQGLHRLPEDVLRVAQMLGGS